MDSNIDFDDAFQKAPNCIQIFEKISSFNFIAKKTDNGINILLIYGKKLFSRGGYSKENYIFYINISKEEFKIETIATSEDLQNYLLVDFNSNNNIAYNIMENRKSKIVIFNIKDMEKKVICNIDADILDFNFNCDKNLIVCFRNNGNDIKNNFKESFKYFIGEIDIQNSKIISLKNVFISDSIRDKDNVILSIDKETDTIFLVCPDKATLLLLK